jgi:eukaryotic-like serine/threonine-protein kinase
MKEGAVLRDRFVLRRKLGRGGTAVTWLAEDRQAGAQVVVKLLSFGELDQWKALELFQREADVLRALHCDGIPSYVDSFRFGKGAGTRFVLVQQFVEGQSLQEKVESGWHGTEEEIRAIAVKLLRIVAYIHSLRPPIVHRDINPRNTIVRVDGSVFLVDFGGVQDAMRVSTASANTVIGTPGYMPLEQFVGKATVRSDLYAVAATILFALTHQNPQDLPSQNMKIDVRSTVELSPGLARVLDSWLEPDEARRTLSIEDAIASLEGRPLAQRTQPRADDSLDLTPPRFSRIRVRTDADVVTMEIRGRKAAGMSLAFGGFSVFWLAFVAFWTFATLSVGAWPMSLFSIPFWLAGFFMARQALKSRLEKTILRLDPRKGLTLERRFIRRIAVSASFGEIGTIAVAKTGTFNSRPVSALQLDIGARTIGFGESLSIAEKDWVKRNLQAFVRANGGPGHAGPNPLP